MPVLGMIQFPKRPSRVLCGLAAVFIGLVKNKLILSYPIDHLVLGQSCLISHRKKTRCNSQDWKTLCLTAGSLCCFPGVYFIWTNEQAETQELLTYCVYLSGQPCLHLTSFPTGHSSTWPKQELNEAVGEIGQQDSKHFAHIYSIFQITQVFLRVFYEVSHLTVTVQFSIEPHML